MYLKAISEFYLDFLYMYNVFFNNWKKRSRDIRIHKIEANSCLRKVLEIGAFVKSKSLIGVDQWLILVPL